MYISIVASARRPGATPSDRRSGRRPEAKERKPSVALDESDLKPSSFDPLRGALRAIGMNIVGDPKAQSLMGTDEGVPPRVGPEPAFDRMKGQEEMERSGEFLLE